MIYFVHLDDLELRQLSKYLNSPLFNHKRDVIRLFDLLRKNKNKKLKKEVVFSRLFSSDKYNAQKLHYINSTLLKNIESFLIWKECTNNEADCLLYLMRAYKRKKLEKPFLRIEKKMKTLLEKEPFRNELHLQKSFSLEQESIDMQLEKGRTLNFNIQGLSDIQDVYVIAMKLKVGCAMLSHQVITKKVYDIGLLEEILNKIENYSKYLREPAVAMYYYIYKALSDVSKASYFEALKKEIDQNIHCFSEREKRDIYLLGINYCIKRLNSGEKLFLSEAFYLYQKGLENNALLKDGTISRWTYNNIIIIGLKLKEFTWVENFIYQHKDNLEERTREDSFNFNLAKFYFEQKNFKKAMPLLVQTKYDDLLHNFGAKTMLSKMYYETEEWDSLEYLLESFKVFISRKKNIGYHKENYLNFIKFIKKLLHCKLSNENKSKTLRDEIENTSILTEKEWLLQQV